jgi:L-threonylcarbamoyladenylate synthase
VRATETPRHAPRATARLGPDAAGLAEAARLLRQGGLVAFPTETVYGLGADATDPAAVARIFAAKGRPGFNPLIVHVADAAEAAALADLTGAEGLIARFWPGPLTLVLPLRPGHPLAPAVTAGLPTVALRAPAHPLARALMAATRRPLAAPSANPSGRVSATRAEHVLAGLDGRIDAVLDGGPCEVGVESAIVAPGPPARLLREGGLPAEALGAVTGPLARDLTPGRVAAPGQLASHYAPRLPVRLDATAPDAEAVLIGFGPIAGDLSLSPAGDLAQAAARLFDALHRADALAAARGAARIDVAPIPDRGLGRAIRDRLARAAAPR